MDYQCPGKHYDDQHYSIVCPVYLPLYFLIILLIVKRQYQRYMKNLQPSTLNLQLRNAKKIYWPKYCSNHKNKENEHKNFLNEKEIFIVLKVVSFFPISHFVQMSEDCIDSESCVKTKIAMNKITFYLKKLRSHSIFFFCILKKELAFPITI